LENESTPLREELSAAFEATPEVPDPGESPSTPEEGASPPQAETASSTAPGQQPTAAVTPEAKAPLADEPPARLKERFGPEWQALPDKVKLAFKEYESAIGRMGNRYGQAAQRWQEVQKVISPYEEMIRAENGHPIRAIQSLFETARVLRQGHPEQRSALAYGMVTAYKIPHIVNQDGSITLRPPNADPNLLHRLTQLEGESLTARSRSYQDTAAEVDQTLEDFLSSEDRPYLQIPGYQETMAMLIESGRAPDLQSAYNEAAWMHQESRKVEMARQASQSAATKATQAARARSAAVSVPGNSPGPVTQNLSSVSLRDELLARLSGEI
jgi:hypothetical protein